MKQYFVARCKIYLLTGFGMRKPESRFHIEKNAEEMTDARFWEGVRPTTIMPKKVKYVNVKNINNR